MRNDRRHTAARALALTAAVAVVAACGEARSIDTEGAPPAARAAERSTTEVAPTGLDPAEQSFSGTLAEPASADDAFTYDPAAAPVGAEVEVTVTLDEAQTSFELTVDGLQPNRGYAVHAHVRPCGPTGEAAGPHFQDVVDPAATPESPSVDPAYANPQNEIWLDVLTDAAGAGSASTTVPYTVAEKAPAAIVIHSEMMTKTAPGEAGSAGGRVACLSIPLVTTLPASR